MVNALHKQFKGTTLSQLPLVFPERSMMPFHRLSKAVQQGIKALRRMDYTALCDEVDEFLSDFGTDMEGWSKRVYTMFRHLHRLWLAAAKRYTQTLCHWGRAATERDADGVLPCRMAGGNLNVPVYSREHPLHLKAVLQRANVVFGQFMALGLDGHGQDPARAAAEADKVVVDYLRKFRVYLKAFDGGLKATLQELMNTFRPFIVYQETGVTEEDILGLSPTGRWELETYLATKATYEEDTDLEYDDEDRDL